MDTENGNLRDEFLKEELAAYMTAHSIDDFTFFSSMTPEEMMELPGMEIQLIAYIEKLKTGINLFSNSLLRFEEE